MSDKKFKAVVKKKFDGPMRDSALCKNNFATFEIGETFTVYDHGDVMDVWADRSNINQPCVPITAFPMYRDDFDLFFDIIDNDET